MKKTLKREPRNQERPWNLELMAFAYDEKLAIAGIRDLALEAWRTVQESGATRTKHKINLACQLAELCSESGDAESAQSLLDWSQEALPRLSCEKDGETLALEEEDKVMALWSRGREQEALDLVKGLYPESADWYYHRIARLLFKEGEAEKGWQMISLCSRSHYKTKYLLAMLEGDERKAENESKVPGLLSQVDFDSEPADYLAVQGLCQAADCWERIGAGPYARRCLEQAEKACGAMESKEFRSIRAELKLLRSRLMLAEGYFSIGDHQHGGELLQSCWKALNKMLPLADQKNNDYEVRYANGIVARLGDAASLEMSYGSQPRALAAAGIPVSTWGRDLIWKKLSLACLGRMRANQALELAGNIGDDQERMECYGQIAGQCRQLMLGAMSERAWNLAKSIAIKADQLPGWLALANNAVGMGDKREAKDCLSRARAHLGKEPKKEHIQQWRLVNGYCRDGQYDLAVALARDLPDPENSLRILLYIWRHYSA